MSKTILTDLRHDLQQSVDAKTKSSFQRFFKETVKCYGIKSATVGKISKKYFVQIKDLDKKQIFALCEDLLQSGYCEEAWIAANWSYWIHEQFQTSDFLIFENWITKYIDNWAECDTLCNHTVGAFLEQNPTFVKKLLKWTKSPNRWLKRAAAVSLIVPAKKGLFLDEIFQIADLLLLDKDDLVQKGYGWLLKEASRKNQNEVFKYVMDKKTVMPRTALRYAIEKMPVHLKKIAMAK